MRALVWHGGRDFRMGDAPRPEAGPGRVIVQVAASAICGSDLHMDDFGAPPPLILGHEVAGTVVEVGAGVTQLSVGARVALDPVQRCGRCWCCRHGLEHQCLEVRHLGAAGVPGGWAEYVAVDAANAHLLPDGLDFPAASLLEPVAVCYESFQRAGIREGARVLVLGDGPFGFLHAQLARVHGAGKLVVAGHHDARLARIEAATGAVAVNTRTASLEDCLAAEVGPPGLDLVIEATGAGVSPNLGLAALRPRGTLVIFSYVWEPEALALGMVHMRELNVLGACRSLRGYAPCLRLLAEGKMHPELLVDVVVPLAEWQTAFARLSEQREMTFKAVLLP